MEKLSGKEMVVVHAGEDAEKSEATPMGLIQLALAQNADVEKLTKLFELQERWEAREAKKAFDNALAAFKANPPSVDKNKLVDYPHNTGSGRTTYWHATIDNVCDKIGPALSAHGLSFRWNTENQDKGIIRVTCILTHRQGHSEQTSLQSVADQSGGKNAIQAIGSAVKYLQRYTLLAATGIAERNADDDGRASEQDRLINETELAELVKLLNDTKSDWDRFLSHFRCGDISELKLSQLAKAREMLAKKKGGTR